MPQSRLLISNSKLVCKRSPIDQDEIKEQISKKERNIVFSRKALFQVGTAFHFLLLSLE